MRKGASAFFRPVTRTPTGFPALRTVVCYLPRALIGSLMSVPFVIGQSDYFGFGFTTVL